VIFIIALDGSCAEPRENSIHHTFYLTGRGCSIPSGFV